MRSEIRVKLVLGIILVAGVVVSLASVAHLDAMPKVSKAASMKKGEAVYKEYCVTCHQANGQGLAPVYPPVAKSDFLKADHKRNIRNLLFGLSGEITVNGKKYNGVMPPIPDKYGDAEIAAVLTYVYNSFGNSGPVVQPEEVAAIRKEGAASKSSGGSKKKKK